MGQKMYKENYQKMLDNVLSKIQPDNPPSLLLHSCCAPCSSYVLSYLSEYFKITVFYYNPNIYPEEEYKKRVSEQKYFIERIPSVNKINFTEGTYETDRFYETVKNFENLREGGERCFKCFRMRLDKTAEYAAQNGFDYFSTTLTVSPYKNADILNHIGNELEVKYNVKYLFSDFKKKDGYKKSIQLSRIYNLYRQDYCGCVFSLRARDAEA